MLTKSELVQLWKKNDFRPKRRLGQNFLIDKNIKNKIIEFINPDVNDKILEIGAGFGEITIDLSERAKKVIAIEKDKKILAILKKEVLKNTRNISLVEGDVLKIDIAEHFNKVVGNLPYYISTAIIEKLFDIKDKKDVEIFIMLQKEYVDRITAKPGGKEYSSISLYVQMHVDVKKLMNIKRTCFYPIPDVDSSFIKLVKRDISVNVKNKEFLNKIIRSAFQQRRKKIINALSFGGFLADKGALENRLKNVINENARPEDLSLEDYCKIANALWEKKE